MDGSLEGPRNILHKVVRAALKFLKPFQTNPFHVIVGFSYRSISPEKIFDSKLSINIPEC